MALQTKSFDKTTYKVETGVLRSMGAEHKFLILSRDAYIPAKRRPDLAPIFAWVSLLFNPISSL